MVNIVLLVEFFRWWLIGDGWLLVVIVFAVAVIAVIRVAHVIVVGVLYLCVCLVVGMVVIVV